MLSTKVFLKKWSFNLHSKMTTTSKSATRSNQKIDFGKCDLYIRNVYYAYQDISISFSSHQDFLKGILGVLIDWLWWRTNKLKEKAEHTIYYEETLLSFRDSTSIKSLLGKAYLSFYNQSTTKMASRKSSSPRT